MTMEVCQDGTSNTILDSHLVARFGLRPINAIFRRECWSERLKSTIARLAITLSKATSLMISTSTADHAKATMEGYS
jgi:hypothetical protein